MGTRIDPPSLNHEVIIGLCDGVNGNGLVGTLIAGDAPIDPYGL